MQIEVFAETTSVHSLVAVGWLGKPKFKGEAVSDYPAVAEMTHIARSAVTTDRPARYAKQLVSHMGNKLPVEEIEGGHRLTFNRDGNFGGYGDVLVQDGVPQLVLVVYAPSAEGCDRLADVLARHLVRFGERDELKVEFWRVQGEGGV